MGLHHIAIAARDLDATHAFYTDAMGFELAKVEVAGTETPDGWARHLFYDTGGQGMLAVWDLHDDQVGEFDPAISTGLGLPAWVNHIAFHAEGLNDLAQRRDRWLDCGYDVAEIDHGWCTSIYVTDPNGILVEWCADTAEVGTDADRAEAERLLADRAPERGTPPEPVFHIAAERAGT